jgi:4-alpha-glucanotransferase
MMVKSYANDKRDQIFGDIPVYVDYNSADVWSNPEFFHLNPDGSMKTVAGVPPDYFNENGQRWGMPIFNWSAMEKDHFTLVAAKNRKES